MRTSSAVNDLRHASSSSGLAALALLCAAQVAGEPSLARISVEVRGFDSADGMLAVAIFDSPETYENRTSPLDRAFVPIVDGRGNWEVEVPFGRDYVVIAYHDANGNAALDLGFLGIPKESVGVSNNVRARFGPPPFEAASFAALHPETAIEIRLR